LAFLCFFLFIKHMKESPVSAECAEASCNTTNRSV
jgi:hypothetical protein